MATIDTLWNNLIDKLLTDAIKLTEEQVLRLQLSGKDIENGKLISQKQLYKGDRQFINQLL